MARSRVRAASQPMFWLRILLFLSIWGALFAYAGRPLLVAARVGGIAPTAAWSALAVLALTPMLPFVLRSARSAVHRDLAHWVGYITLALFAMLFVAVAITDIIRLALLAANAVLIALPHFDVVVASFAALGGAVLLTALGAAQAYCPATRRVRIPVAHLPAALEGYRIVQWSDVHVGPTIRRRFMQTLVDRTNALAPDAVVITGDFIDAAFDSVRDQLEPVRGLAPKDGVFYVTGNHEYYWNVPAWLPDLRGLGVRVLNNEHERIARGDAQLVFAGVTDPVGRGAHRPDMAAALDGVGANATTILLSHRPQMAEEASRRGVAIQLSGHTHGGQFFPFNLVIGWFQPIVAGLHRVGTTWLYVSRGTGYWGPPSRLGVGGELTVIELTRG